MKSKTNSPGRISSYFRAESLPLAIVTVTGILYNIGMTAGPWFEGRLAQTLSDIINGSASAADMLRLAAAYVAVILFVQAMRCAKRFYVRRFANNVNRSMKRVLYSSLVRKSKAELDAEGIGGIMTKAVSDVDTCAEGIRKFTTEVFDTGVVLVAYTAMLFIYDWRLALISGIFPPFAYLSAQLLKKAVTRSAAACKESAGRLNGDTLDRVSGAVTYRVLGSENARDEAYEEKLADYEKKAVRSGILETSLQPIYYIASMAGVLFIIWFGGKNVLGTGWTQWDIAAFTTFLSCFSKLALKSSKAAKLFNSVQKASASWSRIKPLMKSVPEWDGIVAASPATLEVRRLSFAYGDGCDILRDISFTAAPGQIIGVTGKVASGKSTLGKVLAGEGEYRGSIRFGGRELSSLSAAERCGIFAYMGHDTELLGDTVKENILLGDPGDAGKYLRAVCMDGEIAAMPDGENTVVGSGGVRLSGGQQERIALARTLCHRRPVIILDDPFSALDASTEKSIASELRKTADGCTVILISHRLGLFPLTDKVLWMDGGVLTESTHAELMRTRGEYRELYEAQTGGDRQ